MEKVYQCECGLWNRKKLKELTDGKAICICGKEMQLTIKDIKPIENKLKSIDKIIQEEYYNKKEQLKPRGKRFWVNDEFKFVDGCRKVGQQASG